jgi:hypothetical protein
MARSIVHSVHSAHGAAARHRWTLLLQQVGNHGLGPSVQPELCARSGQSLSLTTRRRCRSSQSFRTVHGRIASAAIELHRRQLASPARCGRLLAQTNPTSAAHRPPSRTSSGGGLAYKVGPTQKYLGTKNHFLLLFKGLRVAPSRETTPPPVQRGGRVAAEDAVFVPPADDRNGLATPTAEGNALAG